MPPLIPPKRSPLAIADFELNTSSEKRQSLKIFNDVLRIMTSQGEVFYINFDLRQEPKCSEPDCVSKDHKTGKIPSGKLIAKLSCEGPFEVEMIPFLEIEDSAGEKISMSVSFFEEQDCRKSNKVVLIGEKRKEKMLNHPMTIDLEIKLERFEGELIEIFEWIQNILKIILKKVHTYCRSVNGSGAFCRQGLGV